MYIYVFQMRSDNCQASFPKQTSQGIEPPHSRHPIVTEYTCNKHTHKPKHTRTDWKQCAQRLSKCMHKYKNKRIHTYTSIECMRILHIQHMCSAFARVCVCVCVCVRVCIYICICVCVCACVCVNMHMYTHVYVYVCIFMYVHVYINVYNRLDAYFSTGTYSWIYSNTHECAYIQTYLDIFVYMRTASLGT